MFKFLGGVVFALLVVCGLGLYLNLNQKLSPTGCKCVYCTEECAKAGGPACKCCCDRKEETKPVMPSIEP